MKSFKDKICVVTGAASGIGASLAKAFAQEGMEVFITDIDEEQLKEKYNEFKALGLKINYEHLDVSDKMQMEKFAKFVTEKYGKVHVLCNNAGVTSSSVPLWETPEQDWDWIMNVNLKGYLNGIKAFLPKMIEHNEEGLVINTGSFVGFSISTSSVYGISKHAISRLTEGLYYDLKERDSKIKVALLAPGAVSSNFGMSERNRPEKFSLNLNPEETKEMWSRKEQMHDWLMNNGTAPDEIAKITIQKIKEGKFYIFTHFDDLKARVEKRVKGILDSGIPLD